MKQQKHTGQWIKLLPAAAVIAAAVFSGISNPDEVKTDISDEKEILDASQLLSILTDTYNEQEDGGSSLEIAEEEKNSGKKTITIGKIKSLSTTGRSGSAAATAVGLGSTQTSTVQVPASGYADGTYTGSATGFGGTITVQVTVSNHQIASIRILDASGETSSYLSAATAVISRIISGQTPNVDAVSGATYSSNGIIRAVQNALSKAGAAVPDTVTVTPVETTEPVSTVTEDTTGQASYGYKDGTYSGQGTGFLGTVSLTAVVENGKIISLQEENMDTPAYFDQAWQVLEPKLLAAQKTEGIDTVSGATYSSKGILEAFQQILTKASGNTAKDQPQMSTTPTPGTVPTVTPTLTPTLTPTPELTPSVDPTETLTPTPDETDPGTDGDTEVPESTPTPTPEPTKAPATKYRDGSYTGSAWGYSGKVSVTVTLQNDKIVSLTQTNKDTPSFFSQAWDSISPQIYANQSPEGIDTVSGATFSSEGILDAVRNALTQALN